MVRSYGVVADRDNATEAYERQDATAASPLLGSAAQVNSGLRHGARRYDGGHASIASSVGNLCNTIMGTGANTIVIDGMLTFPLSMASSGLLPGILTCLFSGGVGAFGLYLLTRSATRVPHRRASFFAISQLTFPKAATFFDAAIAIKCFGVSISYLIIIKGLMPNVVASLYHDLLPGDPPEWSVSGRLWITLFMAVLIPLCFLRRLDSLRYASYIAVFAVVYLVLIVIVCYFYPTKGTIPAGPVYLIHFTPNFVSTFPVQVFAYTCSQNVFPIYNELVTNTQKRMNWVIGTSIGSATLAYEIIAVFGYLTFGTNVRSNIVAMYPSTSLFIAVGQLAIVVTVLLGYPLQVHPCRNCLDKVFRTHPTTARKPVVATQAEGQQSENDQGIMDDGEDEHGKSEMTALKHTLLTSFIISCGFLIAYFVDDLQLVLSFVGSTGSTTISFILPGLFFWRLFREDPHTSKTLRWGALALVGYGIIIFVFCLSYNLYQVIHGPRSV